jgi:ABC-type glycerol-3-phosphate transport system permease component
VRHPRAVAARAAQAAAAWAVAALWLVPFVGVLVVSVSPSSEVVHGWWHLRLSSLSLANYAAAWSHPTAPIGRGLANSLLVAVPATVAPILLAAAAAYGLLRYRFPLRTPLFVTTVLLMAIPQHMVAVPLFQMLQGMRLINTYAGLVLVHAAWGLPWIIVFLRGFFSTLPIELEEAAALEGAGPWRTFLRVVLPTSWPGLASVASLQFTWVWNDFFLALIFVYDPAKLVATQRIPLLRGQYHVDWSVLSAAAMLVTAVPLLVFALLQKHYVKGFTGFSEK